VREFIFGVRGIYGLKFGKLEFLEEIKSEGGKENLGN
jgi:hypothetical protein